MKDAVVCDKPRGVDKQIMIRGYPNGETHLMIKVSTFEYIGCRSEPGELKHLSTQRKRNQLEIPSVVASECGRAYSHNYYLVFLAE
jgi:hypothetical protein